MALTTAIVVTVSPAASPASADEPCDLVLRAAVIGGATSGDLESTAIRVDDDLWTYSVTAPTGHSLEWLDGAFPVMPGEAATQIGGGLMTRELSLTGEFVQLAACFSLDATPIAQMAVRNTRLGVALL